MQISHSPTDGHLYCSLPFDMILLCTFFVFIPWTHVTAVIVKLLKNLYSSSARPSSWETELHAWMPAIDIVTAVIRCTHWRAYCSRILLREMVRSGNCCHREALRYSIKLLFNVVGPIYSYQEYISTPTSLHPQLLILQVTLVFTCWWIWNISLMFSTSFSDYHCGWTLFHIFISHSHRLIYELLTAFALFSSLHYFVVLNTLCELCAKQI